MSESSARRARMLAGHVLQPALASVKGVGCGRKGRKWVSDRSLTPLVVVYVYVVWSRPPGGNEGPGDPVQVSAWYKGWPMDVYHGGGGC
jgi:hypothetical protein